MSVQTVHWKWSRFRELSLQEWHDLLQLRINVFVVEQNCPYPELDGKDPDAIHVMGMIGKRVVATARILPAGLSYPEVSIGRVTTAGDFRGQGLGRILMEVCLLAVRDEFGKVPVRISAQTYLKQFYEDLGFTDTGKSYLEDGIPHLEMYLDANDHQNH